MLSTESVHYTFNQSKGTVIQGLQKVWFSWWGANNLSNSAPFSWKRPQHQYTTGGCLITWSEAVLQHQSFIWESNVSGNFKLTRVVLSSSSLSMTTQYFITVLMWRRSKVKWIIISFGEKQDNLPSGYHPSWRKTAWWWREWKWGRI